MSFITTVPHLSPFSLGHQVTLRINSKVRPSPIFLHVPVVRIARVGPVFNPNPPIGFPLKATLLHFAFVPVKTMNLKVNGDARDLPEGETIRTLVLRYNLKPEKVSIELNRRLVRASGYDTPLKEGDEVEIVTFVGGGA